MSHHHYQTWSMEPNFADDPRHGVQDSRVSGSGQDGRPFETWPGRSSRTMQFSFQTFDAAELVTLREFFDFHGGRAKAFYMPSWLRDFDLATDAEPGDMTLTIAGHWHSTNVTSNRPDSIGRRLMTIAEDGTREFHWIRTITPSGANDILTLEDPVASAKAAGKTAVCICYLARLTNDTIELEHQSPTHASFQLSMRDVKHRRSARDVQDIEDGPRVDRLEIAWKTISDDIDPIRDNFRTITVEGPAAYETTQTTRYVTNWTFALDPVTNEMTMDGPGSPIPTDHYGCPTAARQIAATFDAAAHEVIAWEIDGRTTVAWKDGTAKTREFSGITPVLFNTFSMTTIADHADSTVVIFYLKPGDTTIYCRTADDDFMTERRWFKSPTAPIHLHDVVESSGHMVVRGMDASHRRTYWYSTAWLRFGGTGTGTNGGQMTITYTWPSPMHDLDTRTELGDQVVGYGYGATTTYMDCLYDGANINPGPEIVTIDIAQAYLDGAFAREAVVKCAADWYPPANGSGPATMTVAFNGVTASKTLDPGTGITPATTHMSTIRIYPDGTFTMT